MYIMHYIKAEIMPYKKTLLTFVDLTLRLMQVMVLWCRWREVLRC